MASKKNKSVSIKKYKHTREMNLGIILFAIVLIYLIITIFSYFTHDSISVYEVREGSIVRDNSYTGLVLRTESVVSSEADGYISLYQNDNSKVKKGAKIYAVTSEEIDTDDISSDDTSMKISQDVQSGIVRTIQNFNENYKNEDFSSVYLLKNEITVSLQNELSETKTEQLDSVIADVSPDAKKFTASQDGIVSYTIDGYEGITKDNFTEENFDRSMYDSRITEDQMEVMNGNPVYKMITGENWSVIVELDKDTADELSENDVSSIKVRIDKDSETLNAAFSIIERSGKYYGCLDFNNSMIRYAEDRFLNVELILEDESGLKIPKSAITKESFNIIPQSYLTTGGNGSSYGVLTRDKNGGTVFKQVDIYNITEDGDVYVSQSDLAMGDTIIQPESMDVYVVSESRKLSGVYNINKGYAVFRKVTVLCESDEYCIVREGEDYGLSNYDHIVQDGDTVDHDEIVY